MTQLTDLLAEMADEIEITVKQQYCKPEGGFLHPSYERKYKRDMEIVERARTALSRHAGDGVKEFPSNDWLPVEGDFRNWGPWLEHDGGERPAWIRYSLNDPTEGDTIVYIEEDGRVGWGRNWSPTWEEIKYYRMRNNHPHYKKLALLQLGHVPGELEAGWQPIETAPQDGSSVLLIASSAYTPKSYVGWWRGDMWVSYKRQEKFVHGGISQAFPTHWMPLLGFSHPRESEGWRPTHRHKKTGGLYMLIDNNVRIEATDTHGVLYQGKDLRRWVRPYEEFFDGRFEPLSPPMVEARDD